MCICRRFWQENRDWERGLCFGSLRALLGTCLGLSQVRGMRLAVLYHFRCLYQVPIDLQAASSQNIYRTPRLNPKRAIERHLPEAQPDENTTDPILARSPLYGRNLLAHSHVHAPHYALLRHHPRRLSSSNSIAAQLDIGPLKT